MSIKINDKFILHSAFTLWLATELLFDYSMFSRLALMIFCLLGLYSFLKTPRIYKNPYLLSYIGFTIVSFCIIFFGYAIEKGVATDMTTTVLLNCWFLFSFTQYCGTIADPMEILRVYKNIGIFVAIIMFVFGLPSFIAGERLSVGGINANAVASFVAYSLIVHIHEFYYDNKRLSIKDILIIVLFLIVLLFTASRKGFLIVFMGWYIFLCIKNPRKIVKNTVLLFVVLAVVFVLILNVDFLYEVIGFRMEALLFMLQGQEFDEASLMSRNHMSQYAWESSQDSLLFGHGLDCFRLLPKAYGVYSHNNYLELIFSVGFFGVLVYYSSSIISLLKIPKLIKRNHRTACLLLALLIPFLVCDFMNVTYFTRRMLIIPSIAIMFLERYSNEKESLSAEKIE